MTPKGDYIADAEGNTIAVKTTEKPNRFYWVNPGPILKIKESHAHHHQFSWLTWKNKEGEVKLFPILKLLKDGKLEKGNYVYEFGENY